MLQRRHLFIGILIAGSGLLIFELGRQTGNSSAATGIPQGTGTPSDRSHQRSNGRAEAGTQPDTGDAVKQTDAETRPAPFQAVEKIIDLRSNPSLRPLFPLLGKDRLLTSQAIEAARLSSTDAQFVQEETAKLMEVIATNIRESTTEEKRLSKNGEAVFVIKPFKDKSAIAVDNFLDGLSGRIGKQKAWLLAKAIPMESLAGGFGTHEIIYRIKEPDPEMIKGVPEFQIKDFFQVEYETRDPVTGDVRGRASGNWSYFNSNFLDALE